MFNILYEDNHLLVVEKPAGLLTQPQEDRASLEGTCKQWLKNKYNKPGNVFLEAIHRLDKSVSGIVVFAKTSKADSRLKASIRNRDTKKKYLALVEGNPELEGTLEHYLVHDDYRARIVKESHPKGKLARLHYRLKKRNLLEIDLETGRYHQIRIQLASIGCPIVGDRKYGAKEDFRDGRIGLHHCHFEIPHPVTKEIMIFDSLPDWEKEDRI